MRHDGILWFAIFTLAGACGEATHPSAEKASSLWNAPPTGCGGEGQACCTRSTLSGARHTCNLASDLCVWEPGFSTCARCGGSGGQPCCCPGGVDNNGNCPGQLACNPGGACTAQSNADPTANECLPCGNPGQLCCSGGTCTSGVTCDPATNSCTGCGGPWQVCCYGDVCNNPDYACSYGYCYPSQSGG